MTGSSEYGGGASNDLLFNAVIAVIFAREFLEGSVIVLNYRTVIQKSDAWDEETKRTALRNVTLSASAAFAVALLVVLAVGIPLGVMSKQLNDRDISIIEGVSKVIASVCIVQLSVKIPVWLDVYWKVSIFPWKNKELKKPEVDVLSLSEIRFNVAWNIWREVAECGVFMIPFFLGSGAKAIPISAVVGIAVAMALGVGMYLANNHMKSKFWLAFVMSGITLFLAVGLFSTGCHEFEEVVKETKDVWKIQNPRMSDSRFPMVVFQPFGYSSSRTVLQITTFWCFLLLGLGYHYLKWSATKDVKARYYATYPDLDPANANKGGDLEAGTEVMKPVVSDASSTEEQQVNKEEPSSPDETNSVEVNA